MTGPRHGMTKNSTCKEKNGTLMAKTKQKFFIKSLQILLNKHPPLCTQVSVRHLMCCIDLPFKFLFSFKKVAFSYYDLPQIFKLFRLYGGVLKTLSFK